MESAQGLKQPVPVLCVSYFDICALESHPFVSFFFSVELLLECRHYHDAIDVRANVATAQFPALIGAVFQTSQ